jgi:hypothetical protein
MQPGPPQLERTAKADASLVQGRRLDPLLEPFDGDTCLRLCWLAITVRAERSLVPRYQPCPDHQGCRRLAFALRLRCTKRISDHIPAEVISPPETHLREEPSCSVSN